MKASYRKYRSDDFLRIRNFLVKTYKLFPYPVNWDLTRWNYARYLTAPMLGAWGLGDSPEKIPDTTGKLSLEAIRFWESAIGIWETEKHGIVGVVCPDEYIPWHGAFGQAFFQRHPDYQSILPEMFEYAEENMTQKGLLRVYAGEFDTPFNTLAAQRGYQRDEKPILNYLEFNLDHIPDPELPPGYRFLSMADENDLDKRRKVSGLSFYHRDPNDWPTRFSYQELQKAQDYRKDLDLVVVRPDGEYVACTIAWVDHANKIGTLEPLGAIQLGMGREVAMEGLRRLKALGAEVAHMDAGLKYYQVIGFQKKFQVYRWKKTS